MKTLDMTEFHTGGGGISKLRKALLDTPDTKLKKHTGFIKPFFIGNAFTKLYGFTLAVVLITLGIIGIVAALTLPTLIQKQNDAENIAKLKKNYSILSQALVKSQLKLGFFETWDIVDVSGQNPEGGGTPANMKKVYEIIKPELKVIKECEDKAGCWHKGITKDLNGNPVIARDSVGIGSGILIFKLADGSNISIDDHGPGNLVHMGSNYNKSTYVFWVDVNGDKRPNIIGRDIFLFILTNKGLVPAGIDDSTKCKSAPLYYGAACTAKVLAEGKIDY